MIVWCASAALWTAPNARGQDDALYGTLVLATISEHPAPVAEELRGQADNLKAAFGYNEFQLLGQKRKSVPTGTED